MNKRRSLLLLLFLIVVTGALLSLRRGEGTVARAPVVEAKPISSDLGAGREAKVSIPPESSGRAASSEPVTLRSPKEIRTALVAKAQEMMERDLGGVTNEDKQALTAAIRGFEALMAGGLSDQHPGMLISLAEFSRKLDRLSAYDEAEWKADAVASLQRRLSEVESLADGESVEALRARWSQEQPRDDLPEAILLRAVRPFGPTSTKKEGLRDELKRWIQSLEKKQE